jgi:hypothetical protein
VSVRRPPCGSDQRPRGSRDPREARVQRSHGSGYWCCAFLLVLGTLAWGAGTVWWARRSRRWHSSLSRHLFERTLGEHSRLEEAHLPTVVLASRRHRQPRTRPPAPQNKLSSPQPRYLSPAHPRHSDRLTRIPLQPAITATPKRPPCRSAPLPLRRAAHSST